jgi:MFS family permease
MASSPTSRRQVGTLCGIQFVDVLGVTSAVTALPAMLAGVSAPTAATPILATAYAMFFGGLLVLGARLGDRHGHRRVLLIGCTAFVVCSLIGATAQEVVQLVAARGLQGAAAAISVPSAMRLLLAAAPEPDARRRALAAWSATGAAAGATGLLVGGFLTELLSWRAVFWVNVPVGVVLIAAVLLVVPRPEQPTDRPSLDLPGAALLTGSVMALIVGGALIENGGLLTGGLLAAAGLAIGAAFVAQQRRARSPLVPAAAFASANLRTGTAVSFVNTATTSSAAVLATLLMQEQLGVSALGAGLALLPLSLSVIAGSTLTGPLSSRLNARQMAAAGLLTIAAGNAVLTLTYGTIPGILAGALLTGTGLGVASVAATAIGTEVEEHLSGTATGVLNTGAQLGTALGVAALLLIATTTDGPLPGTAIAWSTAAVLAAATATKLLATSPTPAPKQTHPSR